MSSIENLIDEKTLQERISQLADEINHDYLDKNLVVICILKGAFYFYADLTRKLNPGTRLEFMRVKSYEGENSTGKVDIKLDLDEGSIKDKDVLIIEDIIDSGNTMTFLQNYLEEKKPNSIKLCVLLDKQERRTSTIKPDYVGFTIPNHFVIGYGLDLNEKYRNYPEINCIANKDEEVNKIEKDKQLIKKQLKNH